MNDNVELGPFQPAIVDDFVNLLNKLGVPFDVEMREDEMQNSLGAHMIEATGEAPAQPKKGTFAFFKISKADHERIIPDLEKSGLFSSSTGEDELAAEDYMCPTCDYHGSAPGKCPTCQTDLLDFSSYVNQRRDTHVMAGKTGFLIVLGLLALIGIAKYYFAR